MPTKAEQIARVVGAKLESMPTTFDFDPSSPGWQRVVAAAIEQEMGPQPGDAVYVLEKDGDGAYFWGCTTVQYIGKTRFGLGSGEWVDGEIIFPYTEKGHAAAQAAVDQGNAKREEK